MIQSERYTLHKYPAAAAAAISTPCSHWITVQYTQLTGLAVLILWLCVSERALDGCNIYSMRSAKGWYDLLIVVSLFILIVRFWNTNTGGASRQSRRNRRFVCLVEWKRIHRLFFVAVNFISAFFPPIFFWITLDDAIRKGNLSLAFSSFCKYH